MMKRKELLKRGLAAMLSATMAFTLAPDVGLLSVPASVEAANANVGSEKAITKLATGIGATATKEAVDDYPTKNGAYADTDGATSSTAPSDIVMAATDDTGITFTATLNKNDGVHKSDNVKAEVTKKQLSGGAEKALLEAEESEVVGKFGAVSTGEDGVKTTVLTVTTKNATPGAKYTLVLTPCNGTSEINDDKVTLTVEIGYKVTYAEGANGEYTLNTTPAQTKTLVYKLADCDTFTAEATSIYKTYTGYKFEKYNLSAGDTKTVSAEKKFAVKSDVVLTPDWKKSVTVAPGDITADMKTKEYDGTKAWTAKVNGKVDVDGSAVAVSLTGEYNDANCASANKINVTKAVVDGSDDYLVNDIAQITSAKIKPIEVKKSDIDVSNVSVTKPYDGTPLATNTTNLVNTSNGDKGAGVKATIKKGTGTAKVAISSVAYPANVTGDDQAKVGNYTMTATLAAPGANYIYEGKANEEDTLDVEIPGSITTNTLNMELGDLTYSAAVDNSGTDATVTSSESYDLDDFIRKLTNDDQIASLVTGDTKVDGKFKVSLDDKSQSKYLNGDVEYSAKSDGVAGSRNDETLTFDFDKKLINDELKAGTLTGRTIIGVTVAAVDETDNNYNLKGHFNIVLVVGNSVVASSNATGGNAGKAVETYGKPADNAWLSLKVDSKEAKDKLSEITTVKYVDELDNDVTSEVVAGALDIPITSSSKKYYAIVTVDGKVGTTSYYGSKKFELVVVPGKLTKDNFALDTTEIVYSDDMVEPKVTFVDPDDNGLGLGRIAASGEDVVTTVAYSTEKSGDGAIDFESISKPEKDTIYYAVISTSDVGNYAQATGEDVVVLDETPITIYAEAPEKSNINNAIVTGIETAYTLDENNTPIKPVPVVTYKYEGEEEAVQLDEGVDYEVTYGENNAVGTGTVTIKGIGLFYEGTKTITFEIKANSTEPEPTPVTPEPEPEVNPSPVTPEPETPVTTPGGADVTPADNSGSNGSGGSGSSGGGGGSSNAKTVKNSDGSTTTTTTTAKGTIETTTKTNADGSKTTSKVVKNKDGSGSVTETSVSAAGTTKVVEVVTDTTGAATEVTTTVSNSKGASMKVTYAAKGTAITVSKVETTGKTAVSIPATVKVGGKTYKVTKIAASALKGNKEITKVTLGKNVKSIGKNAFNGDSKLKTIVMKKAPTTVGKNAFKGIAKKATIKIKATKKAFKTAKKLIKKSGVASTVKIKRA